MVLAFFLSLNSRQSTTIFELDSHNIWSNYLCLFLFKKFYIIVKLRKHHVHNLGFNFHVEDVVCAQEETSVWFMLKIYHNPLH